MGKGSSGKVVVSRGNVEFGANGLSLDMERVASRYFGKDYDSLIGAQMGVNKNKQDLQDAQMLDDALKNMSFSGEIWRGAALTQAELNQLKVGQEWKQHNDRNALSSWTEHNGVAFEFANRYITEGHRIPVLFVSPEGTRHGASVKNLSHRLVGAGWEEEVTLSSKSKFQIIDKYERPDFGGWLFVVKEK